MEPPLKAVVLVGSLSPSPARSSSELLGTQVLDAMRPHGVTGTVIRLVDHDIKPGVEVDMGDSDAWPDIREQVLDADILVLATPIWMGQPSSVTKRALERLDAELSETDDEGRMLTYGKVAAVAVVGNEDGAHHTSAELFQALNDVGFSLAAGAVTYWVGEAMAKTDYQDLDETPELVATTTKTLASNTVHLARLLRAEQYPPV
jgi:multimeric flavodoxin WrbA